MESPRRIALRHRYSRSAEEHKKRKHLVKTQPRAVIYGRGGEVEVVHAWIGADGIEPRSIGVVREI